MLLEAFGVSDEIYNAIGEILASIAPAGAETVEVDAEISPEGDHCKLLFDYTDVGGQKNWFLPKTAKVDSDLLNLLVKLRLFFDENNFYSGNKPWGGCLIVVNLRTAKVKIEFRYDQ